MARLIVEEGGQEKRFRLNEGKLTLGSGDECELTLQSDELAEVHAELELAEGIVTLRMRKGVRPAAIGGHRVTGEEALAHGVPVHLGGVTITIEYDEGEKGGSTARMGVKTRKRRASQRGREGRRSGKAPKRASHGVPTWGIIGIALLLVAGGYKVLESYAGFATERAFDAAASYERARSMLADRIADGVLEEVARAEAQELPADWKPKFEKLRSDAEALIAAGDLALTNSEGTSYFEREIKSFETKFVEGRLDETPRVRVLLKRLKYFERTWPKHHEIDWVKRKIGRYARIVDLTAVPTYEDIAYEVKTLTWAKPRDYEQAFALLYRFEELTNEYDKVKATDLIEEKKKERQLYFDELMKQARDEYEAGKGGAAVGWIVSLVTMIGDDKMANEAAKTLLRFPDIDERLRGYQRQSQSQFHRLVENDIIARRARELELIP